MPRKKKKDWPEVTPLKKNNGLPEQLPIYINGDIDVTCQFCIYKPYKRNQKPLNYCINKTKIKKIKYGFILSCEGCQERKPK